MANQYIMAMITFQSNDKTLVDPMKIYKAGVMVHIRPYSAVFGRVIIGSINLGSESLFITSVIFIDPKLSRR